MACIAGQLPPNVRVYEMKRIVELRLCPPRKTLMQAELLANPLLPLYFIYVVSNRHLLFH